VANISPPKFLDQIKIEDRIKTTDKVHRYGDFDGFFAKSNITSLMAATGKQ
jgi:hypothetical protein